MSGIAGIVSLDGAPVDCDDIQLMTSAMRYRGPDGVRHWVCDHVALGHCHLSTMAGDLADPPCRWEADGRSFCMAGTLDNSTELSGELSEPGTALPPRSDAELIIHAIRRWGPAAFRHFVGDFAVAVWDTRERKLTLVRDQLGAKPLFYCSNDRRFAFASDIAALLRLSWVAKQLDDDGLYDLVTYRFEDVTRTVWKGIRRLPPAHQLVLSNNRISISEYWAPDYARTERHRTQRDYVEHYRTLLFDAVRRQSRSDRALACEVSGGLDSSGVFAVASALRSSNQLQAPSLFGYTLHFPEGGLPDEIAYARLVADFLGEQVVELPPSIWSQERHTAFARIHGLPPPIPNGAMFTNIFASAASSGSRVILNGAGGDEWLSGHGAHYGDSIVEHDWRRLWELTQFEPEERGRLQAYRSLLERAAALLVPNRLKEVRRKALNSRRAKRGSILATPRGKRLVDIRSRRDREQRYHAPQRVRRPGQLAHAAILASGAILINRERMEHLAALEGLARRSPLFSLPLVEFSIATSAGRKQHGSFDRALHREALQEALPSAILQRRSKADFAVTTLRTMAAFDRSSAWPDRLTSDGWTNRRELDELLGLMEQRPDGSHDGFQLWLLFCLATLAGATQDV